MGKGVALFGFGLACWIGGGATAYFLVKKELEQKYEDIADKEIAAAAKFYARQHKEGEYEDPVKLAEQHAEEDAVVKGAIQTLEYGEVSSTTEDQEAAVKSIHGEREVEEHNVFEESDTKHAEMMEEYEKERRDREMRRHGFIISKEEFMENEIEYEQSTLTYFEGDDVLADDKDDYIRDVDAVVGEDNLDRFGFLSGDNNVVYIRNDRLKAMYEVLHSSGEYKKEVLGFIHSDDRPGKSKIRRFRE